MHGGGDKRVDGVLLDIGVSSYQLDNPERGFSYNQDGRLDMRMDTNSKLDAFTVVNSYDREQLARVIFKYGEEKWASRIAKFIVEERGKGKIETTGQLVDIIKAAIPASARREGPHPAKRTFQAIRIEVNRSLKTWKRAWKARLIVTPGEDLRYHIPLPRGQGGEKQVPGFVIPMRLPAGDGGLQLRTEACRTMCH